FTLIELMITVVIVGILAMIAVPSYTSYITKSRRSDAMASLLLIHLQQEKLRVNCVRYAENLLDADGTDDTPDAVTCGATADSTDLGYGSSGSTEGYYVLSILEGANAISFIALAAPAGPQVDDLQARGGCGTFAINQDGPVENDEDYADRACWQR
ncbi:MAG: prepilin-type N-terminal cleavage/methylation domain-containing protein, partial [Gammaproteobacteria bacterium]|nr:prepilin-type N-terminal cleavage/methylation domain-containing protein [Gammaproteobacteria bacterium]